MFLVIGADHRAQPVLERESQIQWFSPSWNRSDHVCGRNKERTQPFVLTFSLRAEINFFELKKKEGDLQGLPFLELRRRLLLGLPGSYFCQDEIATLATPRAVIDLQGARAYTLGMNTLQKKVSIVKVSLAG
ncbi:MAG: hypothetical protein KW806_01355 [Candidatus Yanofskybacteria bacterium]|nr:hypothetical protein [Candidatus Yanofskybacteria bacterium]